MLNDLPIQLKANDSEYGSNKALKLGSSSEYGREGDGDTEGALESIGNTVAVVGCGFTGGCCLTITEIKVEHFSIDVEIGANVVRLQAHFRPEIVYQRVDFNT